MILFGRIYIPLVVKEFWQLGEQMFEIIIRFQLVQFCGFRYTVDHGTRLCSPDGIVKQPVFLADTKRADEPLAELSISTFPSVKNAFRYFS